MKNDRWSSDPGKHSYAIDMDGIERRLQIHIPGSYSGGSTPLVVMFHGSGGSGQAVYLDSQWKELSEEEGFIVIFPTALEYFVLELQRMQTKWSAVGLDIGIRGRKQRSLMIFHLYSVFLKRLKVISISMKVAFMPLDFSNGGGFLSFQEL